MRQLEAVFPLLTEEKVKFVQSCVYGNVGDGGIFSGGRGWEQCFF